MSKQMAGEPRVDPDILGQSVDLAPNRDGQNRTQGAQLDRTLGKFDQATGAVFILGVLDRRDP